MKICLIILIMISLTIPLFAAEGDITYKTKSVLGYNYQEPYVEVDGRKVKVRSETQALTLSKIARLIRKLKDNGVIPANF